MFLLGRFLIQVLHTEWQILHFVLCFIPTNSAFDASLNHDLMSMPEKGRGGGPSPNCHCVYCTEIEARAEKIVVFDRRPFDEIYMSEVMFTKKVSLISSNYKWIRYAAIIQRHYNLLSRQILS